MHPKEPKGEAWKRRRWPPNLSTTMISYLKTKLIDDNKRYSTATKKALEWRALCDEKGNLTKWGRVIGLSRLPLETQCSLINIPLEQHQVDGFKHPEKKAIEIINGNGRKAYFSENTFIYSIMFLAFIDKMIAFAQKNNGLVHSVDLALYSGLFDPTTDDTKTYPASIDKHTLQNNLRIVLEWLHDGYSYLATPDPQFYKEVVEILGVSRIRQITKMYLLNPPAYRQGWPDLIVMDQPSPIFVEVKTTDRLLITQIITISDLMKWTDIPVKCMQLIPNRAECADHDEAEFRAYKVDCHC